MAIGISTFKQGAKHKKVTRSLWQSVYDLLWVKFGSTEFAFEDALKVVYQISNSKEVKFASKILNKLEDEAYLVRTRAEYDKRVSVYRLLNPAKITEAWAIFSTWHASQEPTHLLKIGEDAGKIAGWEYMYVKDSAVWFWSRHYRSTEVFHISVPGKDADGWVALFKLFDYSLILDGKFVHESKTKQQAAHIHADLESRREQAGEMHGHYQPVHYTIAECFADNDNLGALAVLIRSREKIDWDRLATAAENYGAINRLGFSMEAINKDSKREIFSREAVEKIGVHKRQRVEKMDAAPSQKPYVNAAYADLERKWNVECRDVSSLEKAARDLV